MNWALFIILCALTLNLCAIFVVFRRGKRDSLLEIQIALRPATRISSYDGWVALELQFVNRSDVKVWIDKAKLVIRDLDANFQTALTTGQQIHEIRQAVVPDECLSMSLNGSLYDAAGRPQGLYSFLLWGTVHYRIGEEWAQANIRPHRIEMATLSLLRVRRTRQRTTTVEAYDDQKITNDSLAQTCPFTEAAKVKSVGR
jgi:hypothetical protein